MYMNMYMKHVNDHQFKIDFKQKVNKKQLFRWRKKVPVFGCRT